MQDIPEDPALQKERLAKQAEQKRRARSAKSQTSSSLHSNDICFDKLRKFHETISRHKPFYCQTCHELWPSDLDKCTTCSKFGASLFSEENAMNPRFDCIPAGVKVQFEQLSMVEEMLISPILPVMSIYRLPNGSLVSRGYVANFGQDITPICRALPRLSASIPLIIVKEDRQTLTQKEFRVNRHRVETVLRFLCAYNPLFRASGITIDKCNLMKLPEDGIPEDLNEQTSDHPFDQQTEDLGPETNDYSDLEIEHPDVHAFIPSPLSEPYQIDLIRNVLDWPRIDSTPINEYQCFGLCSLAFPKLFPFGLADPTLKERKWEVSETKGKMNGLKSTM